MKLTTKDLRKLEVNRIIREANEAKKENDIKKLSELSSSFSKIVSNAAFNSFKNCFM